MNIRQEIKNAIEEMGYVNFTEIQEMTIPKVLDGADIIGNSHTGTGKTAAFTIPLLDKIDFEKNDVQAIILAPTRELTVQIRDEILKIGKYISYLRVTAIYGGEPIPVQFQALRKKPQIVVGTPGRTIDHLERGTLKLDQVKFFVLDEADEMLKMGFKEDIEKIFESASTDRQTLMFSATMPKPILNLANIYMKNPELVKIIGENKTNQDVTQYYYTVKPQNKVEALYRIYNIYQPKLSLVFCNTKKQVDELTQELINRGINCDKIHGELPQTTRMDVLNKFHNNLIKVLVATDVAARGLDIKMVEAVFNFDVPEKADHYVHRIGRTGRIGEKGYAFTLCSKKELSVIADIERITQAKLKKRNIPTIDKVRDVKNEKFIEEMYNILIKNDLEKETALLDVLLASGMEEQQIMLALLKMIDRFKHEESSTDEDINENFEEKTNNKNGKTTRFFINLGRSMNLTIPQLLDIITKYVKIRKKNIDDVQILGEFSFFTVPFEYTNLIIKGLNNKQFKTKKIRVEVTKGDKKTK